MKKIYLLFSFLLLIIPLCSQVTEGDIEVYLNTANSNMPGSSGDEYTKPTNNELDIWNEIIDEIFTNNLTAANILANSLNYEIIEFIDTTLTSNNVFFIIQESLPQNKYWGTYVINKDPLHDKLVLQAPHPVYDANTGLQAIFCFKRLKAKALFISGTHRCNHSQFSDCSGTTSVCGGVSSPYRISDNAHNTVSVFQRITEKFSDVSEGMIFVQLHGFAKGDADPYVIMSNGTRVTPAIDYISFIKEGLLLADPTLTFKIAHIDLEWDRLIAFSNTQGRYINNSSDACTQNAITSEGRFIHIEQERYKLRQDSVGWYKMYVALNYAFSGSVNIINYEVQSFDDFIIYPNPVRDFLVIDLKDKEIKTIQLFNTAGILLDKMEAYGSGNKFPIKNLNNGIYLINVITKDNITFSRRIIILR